MSIKKVYIIILLAFFLTKQAAGQDSVRHSSIFLSIGVNQVFNKDLFQSPYTYKGTNLLVNSNYSHIGERGRHMLDLTYSMGRIQSIVSPEADNKMLLFKYDYLFKLKRKAMKAKLIPSLGVGLHALLSNTNYLPKIASPKNYLSACAFLAVSGEVVYFVNKRNKVGMQIGIPLFGLVHRPDFEINERTLTQTTIPGKSSLFSINMEYAYKLTTSSYLMATYHYHYFTFKQPRSISILQNGLLIGVRKIF